ncbi:MAG TPA: hypothetical protein VH855_18245, partial [Acetobacteraceae bacterium]
MSLALTAGWSTRRRYRVRRALAEAVAVIFALVLLIWSLLPIYNMLLMSLDKHNDIFSGAIWPPAPTLDSFRIVVTEGFWYLEYFWHQYANSIYVGVATTFFTLLIGSLTSFTVGRIRP